MSKRTTTTTKNGVRVNRKTGEALNNGRQQTFPVDQDLKKLEREIAHAYGELVDLKESKDDATAAHKEGQDRLNALVAELTRRVNGEQLLPLK